MQYTEPSTSGRYSSCIPIKYYPSKNRLLCAVCPYDSDSSGFWYQALYFTMYQDGDIIVSTDDYTPSLYGYLSTVDDTYLSRRNTTLNWTSEIYSFDENDNMFYCGLFYGSGTRRCGVFTVFDPETNPRFLGIGAFNGQYTHIVASCNGRLIEVEPTNQGFGDPNPAYARIYTWVDSGWKTASTYLNNSGANRGIFYPLTDGSIMSITYENHSGTYNATQYGEYTLFQKLTIGSDNTSITKTSIGTMNMTCSGNGISNVKPLYLDDTYAYFIVNDFQTGAMKQKILRMDRNNPLLNNNADVAASGDTGLKDYDTTSYAATIGDYIYFIAIKFSSSDAELGTSSTGYCDVLQFNIKTLTYSSCIPITYPLDAINNTWPVKTVSNDAVPVRSRNKKCSKTIDWNGHTIISDGQIFVDLTAKMFIGAFRIPIDVATNNKYIMGTIPNAPTFSSHLEFYGLSYPMTIDKFVVNNGSSTKTINKLILNNGSSNKTFDKFIVN